MTMIEISKEDSDMLIEKLKIINDAITQILEQQEEKK